MSNEAGVRKLMQACEKEPALFGRFVDKPDEVAKEFGITLAKEEIDQLKRVQRLQQVIDDFKAHRPGIPGPSGYPIEMAWKTAMAHHIIFYRPSFYPIFYPAWDNAIRNNRVIAAAKIPWWKWGFYPVSWEGNIREAIQTEGVVTKTR